MIDGLLGGLFPRISLGIYSLNICVWIFVIFLGLLPGVSLAGRVLWVCVMLLSLDVAGFER